MKISDQGLFVFWSCVNFLNVRRIGYLVCCNSEWKFAYLENKTIFVLPNVTNDTFLASHANLWRILADVDPRWRSHCLILLKKLGVFPHDAKSAELSSLDEEFFLHSFSFNFDLVYLLLHILNCIFTFTVWRRRNLHRKQGLLKANF